MRSGESAFSACAVALSEDGGVRRAEVDVDPGVGMKERGVGRTSQTERTCDTATEAAIEDRLPEMLDDVLGRLSEVGVHGLLKLAEAMVEARRAASPTAHLAPASVERN